MGRWMDGWMDGWVDGWMDGWVDGWMDGWMDDTCSPVLEGVCKSVRLCTNYRVTELVLFSQPLQNNNNTI